MQVIVADRLFDSVTGSMRSNLAVVVDGETIVSVESDAGLPASTADGRLEFPDATVMPGLIDCHVHIVRDGSDNRLNDPVVAAIRGVRGAAASVRAGVTSVRCVGTPENVDFAIRNAIRDGEIIGPRVVATGRPLSITGGHTHTMAIESDGPEEFVRAVRTQVKAGADVIKLMVTGGVLTPGIRPGAPHMTREEICAAIAMAHRLEKKVCGHAEGPEGVRDAIECGIDSVEHGHFAEHDDLLDIMKEKGTYLVPTLIAYAAILEERENLSTEFVFNAELAIEKNQTSFQRALAAGVNIAMGSDAGTPGNLHGDNWREVELMVNLGMRTSDALQASTLHGARLLGLDRVGQLADGYAADVLVVSGDPLEDISALANVNAVWAAGVRVR